MTFFLGQIQMTLSTSSPEADVLAWVNTQLDLLFPGEHHVSGFLWKVPSSKQQERWAGTYHYMSSLITLNPEFFQTADSSQHIEDVLLHELCHHVQRLKFGHNVPVHGREFREPAYYVNGRLGRDAVTIYHSLARTPEGAAAERAQRKALALLARTTSSNEHEAALAAAKYAQFTTENNIVLDAHSGALADALPALSKELIWVSKNKATWLASILYAVAYTHGCTYTYIRQPECTHYHFYGRPIKISQAYDMIEYLTQAIDRVVAKAKAEDKKVMRDFGKAGFASSVTPRGRSYWMAFREGVAQRIAQSLRDDHKRRLSEGVTSANGINHIPGLVLTSTFERERSAAEDFMHDLHPKLGKGSSCTGSRSIAGRSAGYAAGASVSVAKQTTGVSSRALCAA